MVQLSEARKAALPTDRASYAIAPGFHIPQRDAEALGKAFEALEKKLGRAPSAKDIVVAARSTKSAFHKVIYDVDDATAAYRYRLERAQYVIQSLRIYLPQYDFTTRALVPDPASDGGFARVETALVERRDVMEAWAKRLIATAIEVDEAFGMVRQMQTAPMSLKDFVEAAHKLAQSERPTATRAARAGAR